MMRSGRKKKQNNGPALGEDGWIINYYCNNNNTRRLSAG